MIVTSCLVACTFAVAQTPKPQLLPWGLRLSRGQELVYTESFVQETSKQKTKISRRFQVENRVLVLETMPTGSKVALFTAIQSEKNNSDAANTRPRSAYLSVAQVDLKGRLTIELGDRLELPTGALPKIEGGCFVELPPTEAEFHHEW